LISCVLRGELQSVVRRQVPGGRGNCVVATLARGATFEEARMRLRRGIAAALLVIASASCAWAEDGQHDGGRTIAVPAQTRAPVLTGKERLGPKWTDEQRIDNCNVPVAKHGNKPRPVVCANNPSS
jgi:hypothetical protein